MVESGLIGRNIELFDEVNKSRPNIIRALALLARTEILAGELELAQRHASRAVALARDRLEGFPHSGWLGSALPSEGLVHQAMAQHSAARASWQEVAVELSETKGEKAPELIEVLALLHER